MLREVEKVGIVRVKYTQADLSRFAKKKITREGHLFSKQTWYDLEMIWEIQLADPIGLLGFTIKCCGEKYGTSEFISDNVGHDARPDMVSQLSALGINTISQDSQHNFTARPVSAYAKVEPAISMLRRYTTIFLVDDSSSMQDIPESGLMPWTETIRVLAECADIVLSANGRLKIHFFNSETSGDNISSVDELRKLCSGVVPRGDTTIYPRLQRHLNEFVEAFRPLASAQREEYPGLNLVVFTDGAPDRQFDALEEAIVETAEDLDVFGPGFDRSKVGIHFIQIGDYEGFKAFVDRVDMVNGIRNLRWEVSHSSNLPY